MIESPLLSLDTQHYYEGLLDSEAPSHPVLGVSSFTLASQVYIHYVFKAKSLSSKPWTSRLKVKYWGQKISHEAINMKDTQNLGNRVGTPFYFDRPRSISQASHQTRLGMGLTSYEPWHLDRWEPFGGLSEDQRRFTTP